MQIDWTSIFNFLIGSGCLLTLALFILNYMPSLRNKITNEFKVSLRFNGGNSQANQWQHLIVVIDLVCSHNEPVKVLDLYFSFSEKVTGTTFHGHPSPGRQYIDHTWQFGDKDVFTFSKSIPYTFRHKLVGDINEGRITSLKVIVKTNKYGTVSSGEYQIGPPNF